MSSYSIIGGKFVELPSDVSSMLSLFDESELSDDVMFVDELSGSTLISEEDYASYEEMFKAKYVLPDYINYYSNNTVAQNTNAWYDLSGTNNKDVANIDYFYYKNLTSNASGRN